MTQDEFRELLKDHLVPMLAGTDLGGTKSSSPVHALVAYEHPCALLMKPSRDADYRVQLVRSQAFTPEERKLIGLFVKELSNIISQGGEAHFRDLMIAIPRRVISKFLPGDRGANSLLVGDDTHFLLWPE